MLEQIRKTKERDHETRRSDFDPDCDEFRYELESVYRWAGRRPLLQSYGTYSDQHDEFARSDLDRSEALEPWRVIINRDTRSIIHPESCAWATPSNHFLRESQAAFVFYPFLLLIFSSARRAGRLCRPLCFASAWSRLPVPSRMASISKLAGFAGCQSRSLADRIDAIESVDARDHAATFNIHQRGYDSSSVGASMAPKPFFAAQKNQR